MRVLVDANIFYSKTLTDWLFFLRRENPQTLTILCTDDILTEVKYHFRRAFPSASSEKIAHKTQLISHCIDEYVNFRGRSHGVPDQDDLHVHAAALDGKAHVLLTLNTKDFPAVSGYEVIHPDDFYRFIIALNPRCLQPIVAEQVAYMIRRGKSIRLHDYLRKAQCPAFAEVVRKELTTMRGTSNHP